MRFACLVLACASLASSPAFAAAPETASLSAHARAKTRGTCAPADSGFFRDQGLTMKLASKLKFRKGLLMEQVDVRVNSGIATLSGGVSAQQYIVMAVNIVAEDEGVHCINNFLRVGPPASAPAAMH